MVNYVCCTRECKLCRDDKVQKNKKKEVKKMLRLLVNLVTGTTCKSQKLNRNYKAYTCSSFCLENTFEEIDFCG